MYMQKYLFIIILFSLNFILNASEIRIVTSIEPPTNYTLDSGEITGTTTDIVNEIKRHLKITTPIEVYPWARSYMIAKTKANIIIFTAAKTQARIDLDFHFIGPVITRKYVLWAKKGSSFNINNLEDIKKQNLIIGAMRGDWRTKYFKDRGFKVQEVANHEQNLNKLINGRFHLWASSNIEATLIAKKSNNDMNKIQVAYIFKESSSYIMLSKDTSLETVIKWKKAYSDMQKTDFFERSSKKWTDILGFEIEYDNNLGFIVK